MSAVRTVAVAAAVLVLASCSAGRERTAASTPTAGPVSAASPTGDAAVIASQAAALAEAQARAKLLAEEKAAAEARVADLAAQAAKAATDKAVAAQKEADARAARPVVTPTPARKGNGIVYSTLKAELAAQWFEAYGQRATSVKCDIDSVSAVALGEDFTCTVRQGEQFTTGFVTVTGRTPFYRAILLTD